jgi:hypothetical protein
MTAQPADKITLSAAADVVAAVPHLLGFTPSDSFVILGIAGPKLVMTIRYDLPDITDLPILAEHLSQCLARNTCDHAVLTVYADRAAATVAVTILQELLHGTVTIDDAIVISDARWWSINCRDPLCCPPAGTPCVPGTEAVAPFTARGSTPLGSRDELTATIAPLPDDQNSMLCGALRQAQADLQPAIQMTPVPQEMLAETATLLASPVPLTDASAARLLVLLTSTRLRDEAWVITDQGDPRTQVEFWSDLTRRAPGRHAAPPASLLAYAAACMSGNGVLARAAVERALNAAPGYSLAVLLLQMLDSGAPATSLRLGLTTGDLDELQDRRPRPA